MLRLKIRHRYEKGTTLLETLVALAILGATAVVFLGGLMTTSKITYQIDERSTVSSLAQRQIEWVKADTYVYEASEYSLAPIPDSSDYLNYSVTVTAEPLRTPDDGIQRITVSVNRSGEPVFRLESYKVDR
ncbi:hypothetical protein ACFLYX_01180 [Chloroflexota bacterium]